MGIFDNSIPLDSKNCKWIGEILYHHAQKLSKPTDKVFDFRMEDSGKHLQEVGKRLGLNGVHPYPLRHGGAAEDLNGRLQDHTAVKARGRWSTDTSLRRYTKVGKVQRMMLMNQVSPGALEYCRWSARNLSKVFQGKALPERG